MKRNGRFMVGLVGVATVVTYLIWTGVSETMVYYLTPVELIQRVEADPTFHDVGVKVSGKVIPGTYHRGDGGELLHLFTVRDLIDESATFDVEYRDALPDTFTDEVEVVLEGRLRADGTFELAWTAEAADVFQMVFESAGGVAGGVMFGIADLGVDPHGVPEPGTLLLMMGGLLGLLGFGRRQQS